MDLKNKTIIVTGASNGLGKELVKLLSSENAKVFALSRSVEKSDLPLKVIKIPLNVRDLDSIDSAFEAIDRQAKQVDALINCAGVGLIKDFELTTREEIMNILGTNLKGNIYIAQEAYRRMIGNKSGHIINVISTSGLKARADEVIYCSSKWGLRGFTESLRLAAFPYGIRVSGVYPGGMKSENFWKIAPEKKINDYMDPKLIAEQIINLLKSDKSISPSEIVIERM